jgi:streptomycin 6-kinase
VLKVIRKEDGEEWHCGAALEAFGGQGVIRPLEHAAGAVLLPRLQPGHDLASLYVEDRDDEATEIIASLIERLPVVSAPRGVASVDRLRGDFSRFRDGAAGFIPAQFVDRADALFSELCLSQSSERLLHGDLHHFNVFFDQLCASSSLVRQQLCGKRWASQVSQRSHELCALASLRHACDA